MREYQSIIDHYSSYWWSSYSKLTPHSIWGVKSLAETYLEKYWLSSSEYIDLWKPIQNKVFINQDEALPELIFSRDFEILVLGGGCLFVEEDFKKLQECMLKVGDKFFVVIENTFGGKLQEPPFRFKFPADISWEELTSGNFVAATFLESIHKEFFVFGESYSWGKYSASDYEYPLDIIGFQSEYASFFQSSFKQSYEEWEDLKTKLPDTYSKIIER